MMNDLWNAPVEGIMERTHSTDRSTTSEVISTRSGSAWIFHGYGRVTSG
jgi:hypothetical protein